MKQWLMDNAKDIWIILGLAAFILAMSNVEITFGQVCK